MERVLTTNWLSLTLETTQPFCFQPCSVILVTLSPIRQIDRHTPRYCHFHRAPTFSHILNKHCTTNYSLHHGTAVCIGTQHSLHHVKSLLRCEHHERGAVLRQIHGHHRSGHRVVGVREDIAHSHRRRHRTRGCRRRAWRAGRTASSENESAVQQRPGRRARASHITT